MEGFLTRICCSRIDNLSMKHNRVAMYDCERPSAVLWIKLSQYSCADECVQDGFRDERRGNRDVARRLADRASGCAYWS